MGKLYVVGTPIGNLSDASPRMRETLAMADAVFCEDTRVTMRLMSAFDIHTPLFRADENTIRDRVPDLLERLAAGQNVAFCSDAGMPGISDPGIVFVDAAYEAGYQVEVVPGPSACVCALVAAGFPGERFFFEGFLPRKAGDKAARLETLKAIPGAVVIYESPHRVAKTLEVIGQVLPARKVALVRELTKVHETCVRGTAAEVLETMGEVRGECVIVVAEGSADEAEPAVARDPETVASEALAQGMKASAAAKLVAKECGIDRSEAYALVVSMGESTQ